MKPGIPKGIVKRFYPFYLSIANVLRTNRRLIRVLFRVRLPKNGRSKVSWDFTTLAMKRALAKRIPAHGGASVLEIGVGQGALLCLYLARKSGITADGVDIIGERVQQSNRVARYNSVPLRIWQSDLFERVEKKYDFICWNASYIPTGFGERYNLTQRSGLGDARAWDGGSDGTGSIARFLAQAPAYLNPRGEILLGVNRFYVPEEVLLPMVQTVSLVLADRVSRPLNPGVVYVLQPEGNKNEE